MAQTRAIEKTDFSGGVNANASPHAVGRTQVLRADNMLLDEQGALRVRDGQTLVPILFLDSLTAILALGVFTAQSGEQFNLVVGRFGGFQSLLRYRSAWNVLNTFAALSDTPVIVPWLNRAFITDGYQVPFVTDGLTAGPIAGVPLGTPGAPSVGVAGASGSTTYTYKIVAFNFNGTTAAGAGTTITTGVATLTASQYNVISWGQVPDALGYYVYRTAGGSTQGKIATVGTGLAGSTVVDLLDIGLTGDGNTPPTVDTTTSVIPGAQFLIVHRGALWAFNTAATTSDFDGPSSLRQSDFNSYTNWPTEFQVFIAKDDGQVGTGLATFTVAETGIAPDDFLVLFKTYSTYLSSGTFGPNGAAPTFTQVKTNMGCVAPRSIEFVTAEGVSGIIRLSHRGFALYDGLNDHLISDPIRPYLFGKDEIVGLDWLNIIQSVSGQTDNPPIYFCACPVLGTPGNTRMFVFDLVRKAWTICTFPQAFGCFGPVPPAQPQQGLRAMIAGQQFGQQIYQLFAGATTDDGAPIAWRVRFAPVVPMGHMVYAHRLLAMFFNIAAQQTVTCQFALGPIASRVTQSKVQRVRVGASAPAGAGFGFRNAIEAVASFEIGLTGDSLYAELSGTGTLTLRGVSYQVEPKPLTRPMKV